MNTFNADDHPHRRLNLLTGQWVLVSPHRTKRPWQGQVEKLPSDNRPAYDPGCYLCPGNKRAGDAVNPPYTRPFVFQNDFSALIPEAPCGNVSSDSLLQAEAVRGECRVICFSPRHDLTLAEMPVPDIRGVVDVWADQTLELGVRYRWVQLFENKGAAMGCSNPHPHGQVWAGSSLPNEAAAEHHQQRSYLARTNSNLLLDYARKESSLGDRVVCQNDDWVAVVPFWAVWPFETLLLPRRRQIRRIPDCTETERDTLAGILQDLLTRYDNLFEVAFPYSMGWHGAPFEDGDLSHWQLHAHFFPPLLRSATVRKFMVGYEMLAEAQRDLTPEQAARRLRDLSPVHYRLAGKGIG